MDLLDRLLLHDAWTTNQLLQIASTLSHKQLDREFEIGHATLRRTFEHIVHNVEVWSQLLRGTYEAAASATTESRPSIDSLVLRHATAARRLAIVAKEVAMRDGWDEVWIDAIDDKEKTFGAAIAHVITHSAHHRAQVLNMLRHTGVDSLPEGDVFSWDNQYTPPSFVADDFSVPQVLETETFRLRMLSEHDCQRDYEAVMESGARLRAWTPNHWPRPDFTLAENRRDLVRHEYEFHMRIAFAYTVVMLDESSVIGCVYINPSETHDALVEFWMRDSHVDQSTELEVAVRRWVAESWPFENIKYNRPQP